MSHNTLEGYFKTIFSLAQHHKYSISDLESLMPFERDVYVDILKDFIEQQEEEIKQNQLRQNASRGI